MRGGARRYSWLGFSEADRCEGPLWVAKRHLIAMLEGQSLTGPNQDDGPSELAAPQHTLPNLVELRDTFEQIPIAVR